MIRTKFVRTNIVRVLILAAISATVVACGSSGGTETPPAPPAPVAPPPPPPPEPTFEERLADLAEHDPNDCRAQTPGFEALGGWLKNDGRELGESRVWVGDQGALTDESSHGASVWRVFTDCAVRSTEEQYAESEDRGTHRVSIVLDKATEDGRDLIISESLSPPYEDIQLPEPDSGWIDRLPHHNGEREDGQRILDISSAGNFDGKRTGHLQSAFFQAFLDQHETALLIVVGGYEGEGDDRAPASDPGQLGVPSTGSSICGAADPLCLFAPWRHPEEGRGTSISAPQVSAALDTVWAVWPDMDILDLRNLAFDCAENMEAREGDTSTERTYSYSNGRSFTSTTNSTWGHGILSLTCLFTPNGGLQNPVTGNPISGGIYGPLAGPVTGASITGLDYTGRDFGYGFAYPVARQNHAMASIANLRPVQAISRWGNRMHGQAAYSGSLWRRGPLGVDLTAAGNAVGAVAAWQSGNWLIRSGVAIQPEGVGSLIGSRAFRAPATVSAAITAAYAKALPVGFSVHFQADHWRTLAAQGRSLWQDADLSESRLTAALAKRAGRHEFALQAAWQSGVVGSLQVDGRNWPVAGVREAGAWLTWRYAR